MAKRNINSLILSAPAICLLLFFTTASCIAVFAENKIWWGYEDDNWDTAGNWATEGVPGSADPVFIDHRASGEFKYPVITDANTDSRCAVLKLSQYGTGGRLDVIGGVLAIESLAYIGVGAAYECQLNVSGGEMLVGTHMYVPYAGVTSVNITGGKVSVSGSLVFCHQSVADGFINLARGTLEAGALLWNTGETRFGHINIENGKLIINSTADRTGQLQALIDSGNITAYGSGSTRYNWVSHPKAAFKIEYTGTSTVLTAAIEDVNTAWDPSPADGGCVDVTEGSANLAWLSGDNTRQEAGHDLYLGASYEEVNIAETDSPCWQGRLDSSSFETGPLDFRSGYYWRVDQIDTAGEVHRGDVWSFTTLPSRRQAKELFPPDNGLLGESLINDPNTKISWQSGEDAVTHKIYFGTCYDTVSEAENDCLITFKGNIDEPAREFSPGALQKGSEYFWRVDEIDHNGGLTKGEVWSFWAGYDVHNTRVASQGFNAWYKVDPDKAWVEQQAEIALEMGCEIYKFQLKPDKNENYEDGTAEPQTADTAEVTSLLTRVQNVPVWQRVLDMPFRYTLIWAYPVSGLNLHDGYSQEEAQAEYQELYDLTIYLLLEYQNTNRSFMLGNWEGDWHLLEGYDDTVEPRPEMIETMKLWFANRQAAVKDARNSLPQIQGVNVYHYVEMNKVQSAIDGVVGEGAYRLVNTVLPYITVDAVSYSARNATHFISEMPERLYTHLDYIESNANFTGCWPFEKAVFIGEYGTGTVSENVLAIKAASNWGCPFILYWSIYATEPRFDFYFVGPDGSNTEQYDLHQQILSKINAQKEIYNIYLNRNPYESCLESLMNQFDRISVSGLMSYIVNSDASKIAIGSREFLRNLFIALLHTNDETTAQFSDMLDQIDDSTITRWQAIELIMNGSEFRDLITDAQFARYLCENVLLVEPENVDPEDLTAVEQRLESESRFALWQEFLNDSRGCMNAIRRRYSNRSSNYIDWQYSYGVTDAAKSRYLPSLKRFWCRLSEPGSYTADFDGNCAVDIADFQILAQNWISGPRDYLPGDINGSGNVDFHDFEILSQYWLAASVTGE
ncbi:hypothetical protein SMSP2_01363 [Limihaloglobus sulfuriphilus]|uniref:Dockerin domain-containing protein n=1 Tax=Limihaloglobus sulfuriphilus TaxID=1851148 RepID=A0A1Q2MEC3_9BACT|nr:hypothetical protein [Limihaloglobus sulfuriphilus]AQQ70999.1 hypothetical protein SMSP2_01363 [Limihaloglobus sulfuriphilus]